MLTLYQVDAFTGEKFKENPAAVFTLEGWPFDKTLQNIPSEINLSETAFMEKNGYRILI